MSHIDVTQGSIETLAVDLDDALDNLLDLSTVGCEFKVNDRAGVTKQNWSAIQTYVSKPMRAGCLVDTTVPSLWPSSRYFIYLRFTLNPDAPILGPFEFSVNP